MISSGVEESLAPAGVSLVWEATFVPGSGNWLLYAAVRRALALGGWPPRVFAGVIRRVRSGHQLGQQCCPISNMADSQRQHKGAPFAGAGKLSNFHPGASTSAWSCAIRVDHARKSRTRCASSLSSLIGTVPPRVAFTRQWRPNMRSG